MPDEPVLENRRVAYFSMEIALEARIPTYSGGLGVLAGDTIRSAADLHVPMVAVTLLHRRGYFRQRLDAEGRQQEEPIEWPVEEILEKLAARTSVTIEGRLVRLRAWRYPVTGVSGFTVPVYLLDSDLPENAEDDRVLTNVLYGGDARYRLSQEVILGIGGVRMLRVLGYQRLERFHMNEGHASLLTLALLDEQVQRSGNPTITQREIEQVRKRCVFTTHTPVPAGHDQFPMELVSRVLGRHEVTAMEDVFFFKGHLNMTYLALSLSHYINGVAKKHGEVSQLMFAGYQIEAITNGVHAGTWTAEPFQGLYDRYMPGWRQDPFSLRAALSIPKDALWQAHLDAKRRLLDVVKQRAGVALDPDAFTIAFARRAAAYKRANLLFTDVERLKNMTKQRGRFQILYAGKAHPKDEAGKAMIEQIIRIGKTLQQDVPIVYLENYNLDLAKLLTSGVDLWLNTPLPPLEASGTSGMKAALNGIPSLSTLDGWWIEGCIEGITGWAIGEEAHDISDAKDRAAADAASLYDKLERLILPMFYQNRDAFLEVMRHAIALNGSFFNTHRMIQQYIMDAYFR